MFCQYIILAGLNLSSTVSDALTFLNMLAESIVVSRRLISDQVILHQIILKNQLQKQNKKTLRFRQRDPKEKYQLDDIIIEQMRLI